MVAKTKSLAASAARIAGPKVVAYLAAEVALGAPRLANYGRLLGLLLA